MAKASSEKKRVEDPIKTVDGLLRLFRMERIVYLSITVICLIPLFVSAFLALKQSKFDSVLAIGLFGPTGAIAVTSGRLLKMWNDATRIVLATKSHESSPDAGD